MVEARRLAGTTSHRPDPTGHCLSSDVGHGAFRRPADSESDGVPPTPTSTRAAAKRVEATLAPERVPRNSAADLTVPELNSTRKARTPVVPASVVRIIVSADRIIVVLDRIIVAPDRKDTAAPRALAAAMHTNLNTTLPAPGLRSDLTVRDSIATRKARTSAARIIIPVARIIIVPVARIIVVPDRKDITARRASATAMRTDLNTTLPAPGLHLDLTVRDSIGTRKAPASVARIIMVPVRRNIADRTGSATAVPMDVSNITLGGISHRSDRTTVKERMAAGPQSITAHVGHTMLARALDQNMDSDITTPDITTPDITTPDITTLDITTLDITTLNITTLDASMLNITAGLKDTGLGRTDRVVLAEEHHQTDTVNMEPCDLTTALS